VCSPLLKVLWYCHHKKGISLLTAIDAFFSGERCAALLKSPASLLNETGLPVALRIEARFAFTLLDAVRRAFATALALLCFIDIRFL
jgi:hypothetical protein